MSSKKLVLLVDDDPTIVEVNKICLESEYIVKSVKSGKACLEFVKEEVPDLVILDVMMRHLSEGFETAKALKSDDRTKDVKIIMLTGVKEEYDYTEEVGDNYYPRDAYLDKPVSPEQILNEVRKLIG